jgi:hypothetical protein
MNGTNLDTENPFKVYTHDTRGYCEEGSSAAIVVVSNGTIFFRIDSKQCR